MEDHKQTEITQPQPLLDDQGHLLNPGYCKRNHYIYNKENIKKHRWRIKEWDYYMISDGRYMTELNFYNISIFAAMIADVIDLKTGCLLYTSRISATLSHSRGTQSAA